MGYVPTEEQQAAVDAFASGENVAIHAAAGTGKTSALRFIAESAPGRRGLYAAFNKSVAEDAKRRFAGTDVTCSTVHALAYREFGAPLRHRLNQKRLFWPQKAARIGATEKFPVGTTYLTRQTLVRLAEETVTQYCRTMDRDITPEHAVMPDHIILMPREEERLRQKVAEMATAYWADWMNPDGQIQVSHDAYLKCQPAGTRVTVVRREGRGWNRYEVPIEDIAVGDRVLSWEGKYRLGRLQKAGQPVTHIASRRYTGDIVTVRTPTGHKSSYTHDHICIARIGDLAGGDYIVYAMRNEAGQYRVGRVKWRYASQNNYLGLHTRLANMGVPADAWVLSVHASEREAALAEATIAYRFGVPTWQYRAKNEMLCLNDFWAAVGDNSDRGERLLFGHGRDPEYPLVSTIPGRTQRVGTRRAMEVRACNLLPGMKVCVAENAIEYEGTRTEVTGGWTDAWQPIGVSRTPVVNEPVYSIEVETTHTYVADGIVTHNCWALSEPQLPYDYILVDEAQDLEPLTRGVMHLQGAQLIAVGDAQQAIYGWRGAVSALNDFGGHRVNLSMSFRFGAAIADEANLWLDALGADIRIRGLEGKPSSVWPSKREPEAVLTRTNGGAISEILDAQRKGLSVGVAGDRKMQQLTALAKAALDLQTKGSTSHRELDVFESWADVVNYVHDEQGDSDIAALVKVVEQYSAETVLAALERTVPVTEAQQVISTAHIAKGLEWLHVRIADDFRQPGMDKDGNRKPMEAEEARLAYVAVTRAMRHLDPGGLSFIHDGDIAVV